MQPNNNNLLVVAALLRKFGEKVPGGAYEVRIPNTLIATIPPSAAVEQDPDPNMLTLRLRMNLTIPGELYEARTPPAEPPAALPEPGLPQNDDYLSQS